MIKELIFQQAKWINKKDVTYPKQAIVTTDLDPSNSYSFTSPNDPVPKKGDKVSVLGRVYGAALFPAYIYVKDEAYLIQYHSEGGKNDLGFCRPDMISIISGGSKTLLSHLWQALRAFATRLVVNA